MPFPTLGRHGRVLYTLVLTLAAGTGGYAVARQVAASPTSVTSYGIGRGQAVAYALRQSGGGHILIAGDSHAELAAPDAPSCGRKVVNMGLSGAKAGDYASFLELVEGQAGPHPKAAVAIVTLGTNHLLHKRNPAGKEAADRYEADLEAVVRRLSGMADRVLVAGIPPILPALDDYVDRKGVPNLTARQAAVCARTGCATLDPYAGSREADFGTARPEASVDGLHLSDYRPAYRSIDAELCR